MLNISEEMIRSIGNQCKDRGILLMKLHRGFEREMQIVLKAQQQQMNVEVKKLKTIIESQLLEIANS